VKGRDGGWWEREVCWSVEEVVVVGLWGGGGVEVRNGLLVRYRVILRRKEEEEGGGGLRMLIVAWFVSITQQLTKSSI
jgi:hypothetical protein